MLDNSIKEVSSYLIVDQIQCYMIVNGMDAESELMMRDYFIINDSIIKYIDMLIKIVDDNSAKKEYQPIIISTYTKKYIVEKMFLDSLKHFFMNLNVYTAFNMNNF